MSKLKMVTRIVVVVALAGSGALALRAGASKPGHQHPAHPGDPVKAEEHAALFDLVSDCDATHTAVADGAWGDPKTWDKGIPGSGARVVIPRDRTVTVAAVHDKDRIAWLRVDGKLRFDPGRDTSLKVVALVGNVKSSIEIGTEKDRIQPGKTARLILGDRGTRDDAQRKWDPYDLSGGLLSHGRMRLFGAEYTSHATPTAVPTKGGIQVRFARAPKGWKVGDTLLFPGLDQQQDGRDVGIDPWTGHGMAVGQHQDEKRTIKSLSADGNTVTLDRPLAYQHGGIYGYPEAVPVGNLSRNVVIESENAQDIRRRGHVMFMHTQDVVIDSTIFRELGRTDANEPLTDPIVKDGKLMNGTDANTRGRYALHFHIRWGATYKQQPFIVRNSALVGSPKLGLVNHGGYGLVDNNVSYRIRGSHFFTENGSEIGRFKGNLAVRSLGSRFGDEAPHQDGKPRSFGGGGLGFWLEGGGVEVTDNVAIGHAFAAFGFFPQGHQGPQDPGNPLTRGTRWEHEDVFLAENLKDPRLAHGKPWIMIHAVPLHMARCVGLASSVGILSVGIERSHRCVLHDRQDLIESCRFVWNDSGCPLGYSTGGQTFRNTQFLGADPIKGRHFLPRFGIGPPNHVPGFLTLENVTIDGYQIGYQVPPRGINIIKGGTINGLRKVVVLHPWGGKLLMEGVRFGHMKGEEPQPILCTGDDDLLYAPEGINWARKFQPFEFVYNGRQVYQDVQKADHVPLDVKTRKDNYGRHWHHGPLDGKTNRQLWEQYRLAIGGRLAPAKLTPCPDIKGGWLGPDVPFDPPVELETTPAYYGARNYEAAYGKASRDDVPLPPRYMFDPDRVYTPQKGYVARVCIGGKEYRSEPTDLVNGVNLLPIRTEKLTRTVVIGSPALRHPYQKASAAGR